MHASAPWRPSSRWCTALPNTSHNLLLPLLLLLLRLLLSVRLTQVTLKYIKPGVALPDFYEVKTTST
jgi:hypothetical protein